MRSLIRAPLALLSGLALVFAACVPGTGGPGGGGDVSFELRVGTLMSFTGDLSPFGPAIDRASLLAVEYINDTLEEKGLSDRISVTLVASEDDQTSATAAVEAATKLVQVDQADVIVGALASTVTLAVAESVTTPNQVLLISPASTAVSLTGLEDDGFLWRTAPSDAFQAVVLAQAMAEAFGADATVNTGARNDAYGTGLQQEFEERWEEGGGTVGESVTWNPEAATFDSEAQQLASGDPDAWLIIDFPETYASFGPALVRAGGWDPTRTFGTDGLRDATLPDTVGDEATEGMRGTVPSAEETPEAASFDDLWNERVGAEQERGAFDAQAFDAVIVAFLAALAAGSSDPAAVRDELQAVSGPGGTQYSFEQLSEAIDAVLAGTDIDYHGVTGPLDFDENGDPVGPTYEVWQFTNGELETLEVLGG